MVVISLIKMTQLILWFKTLVRHMWAEANTNNQIKGGVS